MKKILLVSASTAFLDRNSNLLKRTEFCVLTTTSGAEALRLHREEPVDLLIAELQLDDMGGDHLCSLLRTGQVLRYPAVILICRDAPDDLARAERCDADVVLTRPVQPVQLIMVVERFLTVQLVRSKRVLLRVKVLSKKGSTAFLCVSHNISVTGMLLETEDHLDMGDRIVCQFSLPGFGQIEADGEVVRSVRSLAGGHHYGVRFIGLAEECCREIGGYIAAITGSEGEGEAETNTP